jgi:methyl-accepting chemotaxis protein WspA
MNLRAKIMLSSGLPLLLVLLLVAGVLLVELYSTRVESAEQHLLDSAVKVAQQIDRVNERASDTARVMAVAQMSGMFGDRPRSIEFARGVLESSDYLTGAYFGYEPDADRIGAGVSTVSSDGRAEDAVGRFLPYWFRSSDNAEVLELTPLVDMEVSYYYGGLRNAMTGRPEGQGIELPGGISGLYRVPTLEAQTRNRGMITEPYMYEGKFLIEQTAPIMIDGAFVGIAGVDRALNDIDDFLRALRPYETAEFLLVSRRGRVVSATMAPELRAQLIENTPYLDQVKAFYVDDSESSFTLVDDAITGEPRYFAAVTVPTGDWHLWLTVSQQEILQPVWSTFWRVVMIVVVGSALGFPVAFFFIRRLISRVEEAASAATRVAEGDLTVSVDSHVTDESGVLLHAIGNMVESLNTLIGKVKSSSVQLVSAATEIAAAAQKQKEINSSFGASTSEIAASTTEITATSRELLQTMQQVTDATDHTAQTADRGRTDLARMEATMQSLANATSSISAKLAVISERANNIGAVVTTITKVADQTNLLSLNAAIEAEKAGEYGLGFSVVAREIRRLADQTAVATLDIERIVGEMQSSVSSGVMEMDRFGEQVRDGVNEATRLSQELSAIIEGVESLKPRFESAHQSMQTQVLGAGQINEAMLELREIALLSGDSGEGLNAASAQLMGAVEALKGEVARFRTNRS